MPKVYIIILNWNGWRDTIECLESVFRLQYDDFVVLVADNASGDNSLDRIADWAEGRLAAEPANPALQHLSSPSVPRPIRFLDLRQGADAALPRRDEKLVLFQTGANLGFAGGNNAALRLVPPADDYQYVWFLNNDTVVDPDALRNLIKKMEKEPDIGICGSTLLYYREPSMVQALGGSVYNPWTARGGHIGVGLNRDLIQGPEHVESRMKYVVGASMLVRRRFLEEIGPMSERYFLYFEEIDWATRARGRFRLGYSPGSIVYHKEGATIGTAHRAAHRSALSEYYATRNRVLFTISYFPYAVFSVCMAILMSACHRLVLGNPQSCKALLRGLMCGVGFNVAAPGQPHEKRNSD